MNLSDIQNTVSEAKENLRIVDSQVGKMADLVRGRLRASHVSFGTLSALKRELAGFNLKTGKWKDSK